MFNIFPFPFVSLFLCLLLKMLGEREKHRSMQIFGALISSIECSQVGLLEVIEINCRSAEHQAEVMIRELKQEITQLRKRSSELGRVAQIKDYNTGLKVYSLPHFHLSPLSIKQDITKHKLFFPTELF